MYLLKLKTLLTDGLRQTFDANYPEEDFRNINIGMEFPVEKQDYPAIWVDYIPVGDLRKVGIGHIEYDEGPTRARSFTRWEFQGHASFTVLALTSFERDRLHDEVVRVMAFGKEIPATNEYRSYIEENEFLGVNFDWDEISVRGMSNTIGTPWQTEEIIYEVEIVMECLGDFASDSLTSTLLPLKEIRVVPYRDDEEDPTTNEDGSWQ